MTYRVSLRYAVPLAGLLAVSACAPMNQTTESAPPASGIVTPWSWNGPTPATAGTMPSNSAGIKESPSLSSAQHLRTTPGMEQKNNIPAPQQNAALSPAQQTELDEARIALGILDRMANRCLTEADAAACTTFQVNWPNLSRQLRQSLSVISGTDFSDPVVPQTTNDFSQPSSPVENVPRRTSASEPSMEKEIPLTPGN